MNFNLTPNKTVPVQQPGTDTNQPKFNLSATNPAGAQPTSTLNFGLTAFTTASTAPTDSTSRPQIQVTTGNTVPNLNLAPNLQSTTKTTNSTSTANTNPSSKLTFAQIEEHINKWTLELEDQEKTFTNQATQINAWDKLLINNNDKIIALNDAVQKVKIDQQTLEQELDFIATQHAELEDSIISLQNNFMNLPQVDVERTQIYQLVENLDTQLKQMSEDIKEVIDYLNEASKVQDSSDPINQVGRILNAHMNSLQWIEDSSSAITSKLDDISKIHEQLKRDSERSFRATYNQFD